MFVSVGLGAHAFLCMHISVLTQCFYALHCQASPIVGGEYRAGSTPCEPEEMQCLARPGTHTCTQTCTHTCMHAHTHTLASNLGNHSQSRTECTLRRLSLLPSSSYFSFCKLYPNNTRKVPQSTT